MHYLLNKYYHDYFVKRLKAFCLANWHKELGEGHGPSHWDDVLLFGKALYTEGVDMDVVEAFAYLHDVRRMNNNDDPEHGIRATLLVRKIRWTYLLYLNNKQINLLVRACSCHTFMARSGEPTVDACFDADRMDLPREFVNIWSEERRMASKKGKELIKSEWYKDFWRKRKSHVKEKL